VDLWQLWQEESQRNEKSGRDKAPDGLNVRNIYGRKISGRSRAYSV
jgi:hypothetical protein